MDDVRRIDPKEFQNLGYLQEVNRRFLHPLGLALEMITDDETGTVRFGGVWDYREDPEGMYFGDLPTYDRGLSAAEKAARIDAEIEAHRPAREKLFGGVIEPVEWIPER